MAEDKPQQLNFTVVPDEDSSVPRIYSNFCAIQNSPFDFTLTFCEMLPLGEKQVREAQTTQTVKAPVRARLVVPVQMVPVHPGRPRVPVPASRKRVDVEMSVQHEALAASGALQRREELQPT